MSRRWHARKKLFSGFVEDVGRYVVHTWLQDTHSCLSSVIDRIQACQQKAIYISHAGLLQYYMQVGVCWLHSSFKPGVTPVSDGQMRGNITSHWEMKRLHVQYEKQFINSGVIYIGTWCQDARRVFSVTVEWIYAAFAPLFHSSFFEEYNSHCISAPLWLFLARLKYQGILHSSSIPLWFSLPVSSIYPPLIQLNARPFCSFVWRWLIIGQRNRFMYSTQSVYTCLFVPLCRNK